MKLGGERLERGEIEERENLVFVASFDFDTCVLLSFDGGSMI